MLPRASSSSGPRSTARSRLSRISRSACERAGVLVGAPVGADVALDGVRHRVHAGGRGHRRRQRARGLGVEDRQPREEREVGDLELDLLLVVLDHRGHRDLGAGAGGGGDAGQRGDLERPAHAVVLARQQEEALLLARAAAVGEHGVGHLRVSITEPPPTARNESAPASFAAAAQRSTTSVEESCGTSSNTPATSSPPSRDARLDPLHQAGAADHLVGDQEDAVRALLLELEAGRPEQVAPRDHPGGETYW